MIVLFYYLPQPGLKARRLSAGIPFAPTCNTHKHPRSPASHRRARAKRSRARALVKRAKSSGKVRGRKLTRIQAALQLLEAHHSRPRYRLPQNIVADLRMQWSNRWRDKEDKKWNNPRQQPKQDWKKRAQHQEGVMSWDGKWIPLGEGDTPSLSTSSRSSHSQAEESEGSAKEILRKMLAGGSPDAQLMQQARELVEESPQEALRREQKELNQRRKELTKQEKLKDKLDKAQSKFTDWKSRMHHTVRTEETRYMDECRDLNLQLSRAEKEDAEAVKDMLTDEEDTGINEIRSALKQQELMNLSLMRQNAQITQQLAQLTQAMSNIALSTAAGKAIATDAVAASEIPEAHVKNALTGAPGLIEVDEDMKITEKEVIDYVKGYPQSVADEALNAAVNCGFQITPKAFASLVDEIHENHRNATREKLNSKEDSLRPFGKISTPKQGRKTPYGAGSPQGPSKSPKLGVME